MCPRSTPLAQTSTDHPPATSFSLNSIMAVRSRLSAHYRARLWGRQPDRICHAGDHFGAAVHRDLGYVPIEFGGGAFLVADQRPELGVHIASATQRIHEGMA